MMPARSSTATAPISTRSSDGCGRPSLASTRCISICTRPSRPRMAAAGPAAFDLAEHTAGDAAHSIGRLKGFHGQMGMFVRALAYMMSHGADGLKQVAEDAVLNANYLRVKLAGALSLAFPGTCMHEVLFDDGFLKDTGVSTLDFAKALIDEGFPP